MVHPGRAGTWAGEDNFFASSAQGCLTEIPRMETTLEIEMVESRPGGDERQESRPAPTGGSTDPQEFLLMRARYRTRRARVRKWKIAGMALAASGLLLVALLAPRRQRVSAERADAQPISVAAVLPIEPAPVAVAPALARSEPTEDRAVPCEQDFSRHQWRAAIDSCTRAFEGTPSAAGALRIAHAHWSHGEPASAGKWAARALDLGSTDADTFVLIGHSERQAGHAQAAKVAYRQYLRRAPRGWHAVRVRAALRQLGTREPSRAVSAAE
jgi:hypothetical protein